jgi:hypothetical protein
MLVESRAQAVTTVRGIVRAHGERVPSCDVEVFEERASAGWPCAAEPQ